MLQRSKINSSKPAPFSQGLTMHRMQTVTARLTFESANPHKASPLKSRAIPPGSPTDAHRSQATRPTPCHAMLRTPAHATRAMTLPFAPPTPEPEFIAGDGIQLAVYRWQRPRAPRLLLIHGYPDNAQLWSCCARELARDFDVTAYDVRGAGRSDRPSADRDYAFPRLMADLNAVIDHVSPNQSVHLVGHDWGALQGWEAVCDPVLSARIASYTCISGPCLDHVGAWLRRGLRRPNARDAFGLIKQAMHSWYIGVFQLPRPLSTCHQLAGYRGWFARQQHSEGLLAHPRQLTPQQIADGRAGIHLYRANMLPRVLRPSPRPTDVPVQVLMPKRDPFMIPAIWSGLNEWAPQLWYQEIESGHWAPATHPLTVSNHVRELVNFRVHGRVSHRLQRARQAARRL